MRITECWLYLYITKQHRLYLEQWAGGISDGPHCHNNGHGPHYHNNGLLEHPLLAADLHQPYRLEHYDGLLGFLMGRIATTMVLGHRSHQWF